MIQGQASPAAAQSDGNGSFAAVAQDDRHCVSAPEVVAVGIVEPRGGMARIAPNVKGVVREVFVDTNSAVVQGDPLFRLDNRIAKANLAFRKRELEEAKARLAARHAERNTLQQEAHAVRASLIAAQLERDHAKELVDVATRLKNASIVSVREYRRRVSMHSRAGVRVSEAEAKLQKILSQAAALDPILDGRAIAVEEAAIARAQSLIEVAKTKIELLTVRAPANGNILRVNIQPGEFVSPSRPAPILMSSQSSMNVRVELDQSEIFRFKSDRGATAKVVGRISSDLKHKYIELKYLYAEPIVRLRSIPIADEKEHAAERVLNIYYGVDQNSFLSGQTLDVSIRSNCRYDRKNLRLKLQRYRGLEHLRADRSRQLSDVSVAPTP